jgi:hypothetical protein
MLLSLPTFSKAESTNAGEYGYCGICGVQIRDLFSGRALENYTEILFRLNNNAQMAVAVCKDDAEFLKPEDYIKIMESVKHGWMQEINRKKWTKDEIELYKSKFFNLIITGVIKNDIQR